MSGTGPLGIVVREQRHQTDEHVEVIERMRVLARTVDRHHRLVARVAQRRRARVTLGDVDLIVIDPMQERPQLLIGGRDADEQNERRDHAGELDVATPRSRREQCRADPRHPIDSAP